VLVQSFNNIDQNNALGEVWPGDVVNNMFLLAAIMTSECLIVSARYLSESKFYLLILDLSCMDHLGPRIQGGHCPNSNNNRSSR
jgi:hypothetical protein